MIVTAFKTRNMIAPALALAAVALVAAGSMVDARPYSDADAPAWDDACTPAQQRFADAPDGVDPIVTGPSSKQFRELQKTAGCDDAVWPNIPAACYPPIARR